MSDFDNLKHILCWSNPYLPTEVTEDSLKHRKTLDEHRAEAMQMLIDHLAELWPLPDDPIPTDHPDLEAWDDNDD